MASLPEEPSSNEVGIADVRLVVRDLKVELEFYEQLGLVLLGVIVQEGSKVAQMGTNSGCILRLAENKDARLPDRAMAGLYHFAIRVPKRMDLAETYLRLGMHGIPFEGFADHGVSESLYLSDPEGNGIEIYSDKPRELWKREGKDGISMVTEPLDIDSLLRETRVRGGRSYNGKLPKDTKVGHIHLKVTDLQRSVEFYTRKLGFDLTQRLGSAAFLSYGGYHHHVGMNTWESRGGPKRKEGFLGLDEFSIVADQKVGESLSLGGVSGEEELSLTDPDGICLKLLFRKTASMDKQ